MTSLTTMNKGFDTTFYPNTYDICEKVDDLDIKNFICIMKDDTIQRFIGYLDENNYDSTIFECITDNKTKYSINDIKYWAIIDSEVFD